MKLFNTVPSSKLLHLSSFKQFALYLSMMEVFYLCVMTIYLLSHNTLKGCPGLVKTRLCHTYLSTSYVVLHLDGAEL